MASLSTIYRERWAVSFWCILECLLFSAIPYGWASLVFVLKQEGFFQDLCESSTTHGNLTDVKGGCIAQDDIMNLAFTVAVFTFTSFGVVVGTLLDYYGPRVTRLTSCIGFAITGIIFAFTDKDRPMLIFPGVMGLTMSGISLFVTMLQISVLFRRWGSLVSSLLNGALDSSSIVLLFFKLIYDAGVKLRWIFIGYFSFAVISIFIFTFILPADPINSEQVDQLLKEDGESVSEGLIEEESDGGTDDSLKEIFKMTDPSAEEETKAKRGSLKEFFHIATSPMYLLLVMYLSIHKLRLWFYMGSMDMFLRFSSRNDFESVNTYLNTFGIIQFTGLLFAPIVGLVMAWRPENKENDTFGFVVAFCLTNSLNVLLNIVVIVPVLQLQVFSFVVQVVLRAFVYSTYAGFILHRFPLEHCGKLYGTGHLIGAIFGSLQFFLFVLVHSQLGGNPFWINVGFLVCTLILYVLPFYVWIVTEKETHNKRPHRPKYDLLKEN